MLRAASKKLATARSELEERRVSLQKTAIDRLNRLALVSLAISIVHTHYLYY